MERILIIDYGSQYTQLITRRVRELNIYSEVHPYNDIPPLDETIKGIIFSGSPRSVHDSEAPALPQQLLDSSVPKLVVCYSAQLFIHHKGGRVERSTTREFGRASLELVDRTDPLLEGLSDRTTVWMSHSDTVLELPPCCSLIARTKGAAYAAYRCNTHNLWGLQFHPEVHHTDEGKQMLTNFLYSICSCHGEWQPAAFVDEAIASVKKEVGEGGAIMAISGGVDSSVAATIIHRALEGNLTCFLVDNGLMRKDEAVQVLSTLDALGLDIRLIDAKERFYIALEGIVDPEKKRKIIGGLFIDLFQEEAVKLNNIKYLGQGTIYPDVIESISVKGPSATIKSHHNVGGLPEKMNLEVLEPLRLLFKDEVREAGHILGISNNLLQRHPFPGPGLAIRILGEVTRERVAILQEADAIYIESMKAAGLYDKIWQAGAVLLPIQTVGVMGDDRTYEQVIALRAVTSVDGMTADWYPLPYDFLAEVSTRIINEVSGVNRVVYDISSKPPATIEWE